MDDMPHKSGVNVLLMASKFEHYGEKGGRSGCDWHS